jgi:hypothetical protein
MVGAVRRQGCGVNIANALRGIGGEIEIGRTLLASAAAAGIFSPIAFETYEVGWNGGHFDAVAWCLAYPGGLAALVTCGVLGIGSKDKSVAAARQTQAQPPLDDKGGQA